MRKAYIFLACFFFIWKIFSQNENKNWHFGEGNDAYTRKTIKLHSNAGSHAAKLFEKDVNGFKEPESRNRTEALQIISPAHDTSICAGSSLTLFATVPPSESNIILPPGSLFEYTFNTPSVGWTTTTGGWRSGNAPFGSETHGDPPEFNYNTYWPIGNNDNFSQLYARRNIDLTGYDLANIHWHLGVDNGFVLYINGIRVDSDYAEGYTNRWEYEGVFPAALLNQGNNIIAIACIDKGGLTAFDMMIDSEKPPPKLSVQWSTGDTTASINVTPNLGTVYYVTVIYGPDIFRDSIMVTVNLPYSRIVNATICKGENYLGHTESGTYIDKWVALTGCDSMRTLNLTVIPTPFSTISQSICQGQNFLGYAVSGKYIDTLVAANGCDSIRTIQLTVLGKPRIYLGADTVLCSTESLILSPGPFATYSWQDGSTQSQMMVKKPGLYSVLVTDKCGSAKDEIMIREGLCDIYFPTAFTPDNNGKNEWFKVLGGYNLKEYHLVVYNRLGQKIFETFDYATGWDGRFNGRLLSTDSFAWYCEFKKTGDREKKKMKGIITLIR